MVKKIFALILLSSIFAAIGTQAQARLVTFNDMYTVEIPWGWNIIEQGDLITIVSSDRQAVFLITHGLSVPRHRDRVAREMPKYSSITQAHPEQQATLTRILQHRVVVTVLGDHKDRTTIYFSIKAKDK